MVFLELLLLNIDVVLLVLDVIFQNLIDTGIFVTNRKHFIFIKIYQHAVATGNSSMLSKIVELEQLDGSEM